MAAFRTMTARFSSSCRGCAFPILPGALMVTGGRGRNYHVDCKDSTRIVTTYFPSTGNYHYQNANGPCEDRPCCGCCSVT